jgi:hypothetical protein
MIDYNSESFKMKFAMALSVFLDKCHSWNNRQTYAFKDLEYKSDINFSEVEKVFRFFGFIVDEKTYKEIKNSYLRKIEMQEESICDDDEHLYNISSIIWEKQFSEESLIGLASRYEESSVQIAFDLYNEVISYFYCGLKDRFIDYIKSNYIDFLRRIRNEVVLDFFTKELDKRKKEYRKIADLREENERKEKIFSTVYKVLDTNRKIFEANMNYVVNWRYYFAYLVKYVEGKVDTQQHEIIKEMVSKHPRETQKKIWKEIHKEFWEVFSKTMTNFPEGINESMEKYNVICQIYNKYADLLPEYKESRALENLDCEEMRTLIGAGMKGDTKIKI